VSESASVSSDSEPSGLRGSHAQRRSGIQRIDLTERVWYPLPVEPALGSMVIRVLES
jgi:hypothetical protein